MFTAVSFHGVRLVLGGAASVLDPILRAFANADEDGPELSCLIDLDDAGVPVVPQLDKLLFRADRFGAFRSGDDIVVTDQRSWVRVESTPLRISGQLARNSMGTGEDLVHLALLIALRELGVFELHAAVVCTETRALVLVGPSGSGKSTAALSLLAAGGSYMGDDRVLLRAKPSGDALCSYPAFFRATPSTLLHFPALAPHTLDFEHLGKRPIDVARAFPKRHRREWTGPTVLLFPKVAARTELGGLGQAEAFERLLMQSGSLALDAHPAPEQHLAILKRLVARSTRIELSMGPEWLEEPDVAARRLLGKLPELPGS